MKTKLLLRFYFHADGVDAAIDDLIVALACRAEEGAERTAEKITGLYRRKDELAMLWEYLDGVISRLGEERKILQGYAGGANDFEERDLRRALMKFRRRARGVSRFATAQELLINYAIYCKASRKPLAPARE